MPGSRKGLCRCLKNETPVRGMLFGDPTTALSRGGEVVSKTAGDDPLRQPSVVASDGLPAHGRNDIIPIASAQFFDRANDSHFSGCD